MAIYLDENKTVTVKDAIMTAIMCGLIAGFTAGIIISSLLHKYIVHPFGY